MKLLSTIIFIAIYPSIYCQSAIKDSFFLFNSGHHYLKTINIEQDSSILNFGKGGKRTAYHTKNITWGLFNATDSLLYSFDYLHMHGKSIFLSTSGNYLVIVNNFINLKEKSKNQTVLEFYSKGDKLKQYQLKKIIHPKQMIKSTKGGIWTFKDFSLVNDSTFIIHTIGFHSIAFNLMSGKISSRNYLNGIDKKTVILYGEIEKDYDRKNQTNQYIIYADYFIQGTKKEAYKFYSDIDLNNRYKLIIINNGQYDTTLSNYQIEGFR